MAVLALVAVAILYLLGILRLGVVPILLILLIFAQKFLANWSNSGYNRGENRF